MTTFAPAARVTATPFVLPGRPWAALPSPATTPADPPTATATPGPSATPTPAAAPTSAAQFDKLGQVIAIGFPLAPGAHYRYRNNWGDLRAGPVEPYNHVFDIQNGVPRRAHDGIDIFAPRGTPLLAPFTGVVISPTHRWRPWLASRYGITVAILSTEPATAGYVALLCHLDSRTVAIGAHVTRGQVIGTLGNTGDAHSSPQLHFEIRAPFLIAWSEPGGTRLIDAFNPYPSLRAADPALAN